MLAADVDAVDIVKVLVAAGADPRSKDSVRSGLRGDTRQQHSRPAPPPAPRPDHPLPSTRCLQNGLTALARARGKNSKQVGDELERAVTASPIVSFEPIGGAVVVGVPKRRSSSSRVL